MKKEIEKMGKTDVKMTKGWPDEILQLERVGDDVAGYYYLAKIVELEERGLPEKDCKFTGDTPEEAIDKAVSAMNEYMAKRAPINEIEAQLGNLLVEFETLEAEKVIINAKFVQLNKKEDALRGEQRALQRELQTTPAPLPLKAAELLEEVDMMKLAARFLDPNMKRSFKRIAFREYKDLDGDGDMDNIAGFYR